MSLTAGYCQCGCGCRTNLASKTDAKLGVSKGQPRKFIKGHHTRLLPRPIEYVVDDNGCWVWQKFITEEGYGRIHLRSPSPRNVLAHRLYYERYVGPIPADLEIDHLCRNRACVNPAHLEPVPKRVNILRGEGVAARFARRTHCSKGHEFTSENTYINPTSLARYCRVCLRDAR